MGMPVLKEQEVLPEVVQTSAEALYEEVNSELQRNFQFSLFCLSPQVKRDTGDWRALARFVQIPEEEARGYRERLLESGIWIEKDNAIVLNRRPVEGELSVSEYLTMTLSVISQLSETGYCHYENVMVATTKELSREFDKKINRAIRELMEDSRGVEADYILAWNHAALNCIKNLYSKKGDV